MALGYEDRNVEMKMLTKLINIDKIEGSKNGHLTMNDNPEESYEKPYQFLFSEGLRKKL